MENKRNFGLDIIRAIAVSLVVFAHSRPILEPLMQLPNGIGWFFGKFFAMTLGFGGLGVELFFVLSGVLIGGILIREFAKAEKFSLGFVKDFWLKRWSRTLPNYYLFLGLNVLLGIFYHKVGNVDWRYLFFVQNFASPHPSFFPEAWSLAVEEWFYLTLPLVLLASYIFIKNRPKTQVLMVTLLAYLSFFLVMRIWNAIDPAYAEFGQDRSIRKVVLFRLDAIAFGVVIAYLNHYHRAFIMGERVRRTMFWVGLSMTVAIVAVSYLGVSPRFNFYNTNPAAHFFMDTFAFSLLPMSMSLMLPAAIGLPKPWQNWPRMGRLVTHISLISYSMYLAHYSLIYIPFFEDLKINNAAVALLLFLGYWALVIGLSTLAHRLYEKPMTEWLRGKLKLLPS